MRCFDNISDLLSILQSPVQFQVEPKADCKATEDGTGVDKKNPVFFQ